MVGTDRSETAERAVQWAAAFADAYSAELHVVQVVIPLHPADTEHGTAEVTRARAAAEELQSYATTIAGERGHAHVVIDDDPALAIVHATEEHGIDVLVVGNAGMAGRKEFLLGNVPNRISHNARCTVIIVNTTRDGEVTTVTRPSTTIRSSAVETQTEPHLMSRGTKIATVFAKHGLKELFGRPDADGAVGRRRQAKRLRSSLEELGPTFAKIGQILSTRPDLMPPEFIEELATLQDNVPPLTEEQVVRVMEQELGVPWEDVFETIDPLPLAAGTIAQVHRATLADHTKVVVKVQRPDAKEQIEQDLALLEVFAEKVAERPGLKQVVDMQAVFEHLSESLHRELDFRREAENIERMGSVIEDFSRLRVPVVFADYSTSRLLVMQDIGGGPAASAPEGPARKEAARQLLESFYKQILVDGFFHADPHPGNLMWQPEEETLYFLDLGMIGEVGPDLREHMMLLLMAFWQQDVGFLTDVTLMLTGAINRTDLDVEAFQEELGALMARNRGRLAEGDPARTGAPGDDRDRAAVRRPAPRLAHADREGARADAARGGDDGSRRRSVRRRRQVHDAQPRDAGWGAKLDPKTLFYQAQRFKVRFEKVVEAIERLIGARPGQKLEVNFRAASLETTIRRAGRRLAISLTAGAAILATALTAVSSDRVARWVPAAFGVISAGLLLALLVDLIRKRG